MGGGNVFGSSRSDLTPRDATQALCRTGRQNDRPCTVMAATAVGAVTSGGLRGAATQILVQNFFEELRQVVPHP